MTKKIISYNVNGLRAAVNKGFFEWLAVENPDVICIQETKLQQGQIDIAPIEAMGYNNYWHYAQKKGYSGVALFSKQTPDNVLYGIGIEKYDMEGRLVRADFGNTTIISVYFPSGSSGDERQEVKMQFLNDLLPYLMELRKTRPNIIISGDYNICHKPIDINHPEKHNGYSGFLPEERAWMDSFEALGFTDSFRVFNNHAQQYSWWSYRANARAKNLGWRIDYNWVTNSLKSKLVSATILPNVMHSDHCPVVLEIDF